MRKPPKPISSTIARGNGVTGIYAVPGNHDGGGNKARGNQVDCIEVQCSQP